MGRSFISRSLLWVLMLLVAGAVAVRFYAYFINEDYYLYAQIPCDSADATCFANDCDPSDEECDLTPFMFAEMSAAKAPDCFEENNCEDFVCPADDDSCAIIECSEDTVYEGVACFELDINNVEQESVIESGEEEMEDVENNEDGSQL